MRPAVLKNLCTTLLSALLVLGSALPGTTRADTTSASAQASVSYQPTAAQQALVDDLEQRTFRWFWDSADPVTGMVPDHYPGESFSSIAAVGFGLTAYGIGVE
ncbi:MAG TPA: Tat pathway signal protein, partial [Dyella sp.]|nr:Tat pathway signal protein [Dyella sp.]